MPYRIKSVSEIHKTSIDIDLFVVTIYERTGHRFHCHATTKKKIGNRPVEEAYNYK